MNKRALASHCVNHPVRPTLALLPLSALQRWIEPDVVVGHEGFASSDCPTDDRLGLWRLLAHGASDEESIELDRLCRLLHALNFYRQPESDSGALFLSVHARLLTAVDSNHGIAFRRVLDALELPHDKMVLQLPHALPAQDWLLNYVADNYRRNGFRVAINAGSASLATRLLGQIRAEFIKVDANVVAPLDDVAGLLREAAARHISVVFKRVENLAVLAILQQACDLTG